MKTQRPTDDRQPQGEHIPSADHGPLSPALAFVVQFRTRSTEAPAQFAGRVEHMASGRATRFSSPTELVEWLSQAFTGRALPPASRK